MAIRRYERATPEGTRDLLFEECAARREVESRLSGLFKARGYNRVITPTLEFFDVFDRESGRYGRWKPFIILRIRMAG